MRETRARVLAQLGRFALEPVDLLDDLDRQQDVVIVELEQRIGVVQQNIGIKDVILFHAQTN